MYPFHCSPLSTAMQNINIQGDEVRMSKGIPIFHFSLRSW